MIPGNNFGGLDLQSVGVHHHHQQQQQRPLILHHHPNSNPPHQGSMPHSSMREVFPLTMGNMQDCDQNILADYNKEERGKHPTSDEDEPSFAEDAADGPNEANRGKKDSPWQRMKWTDSMVRLLITAVSYTGEDVASECGAGGRRRCQNLQKKGKWKSISRVMAERGCYVSPQQCEDKFNDLNKRYKRLNEVLGRGTSCQVVENPALLDTMDHLSEKTKEDVRKILSSKHLFYEEMCSYHNGNRLYLPPDPALQRSLQLALRTRDDHDVNDVRRHPQDDHDEDDQDAEIEDRDELEENHAGDNRGMYGLSGGPVKRMKQSQGQEDANFGNHLGLRDCNRSSHPHQQAPVDMNQVFPEGTKADSLQKQWIKNRSLELEEQKLQIQVEMLELERERFKWQKFTRKKDRELDKLKMENEMIKLENERMALELKRKELELSSAMMGKDLEALACLEVRTYILLLLCAMH
ncbi:Myb/SANT-like DNA-binding domain 4 [Dillenia turbinata]|uniref:Myb/SANT-like DNA-binding domain 4 n=1 Tax=Dillenia turbinata TaxID=194707 RepID=A0AAN8VQD2_9MAGN